MLALVGAAPALAQQDQQPSGPREPREEPSSVDVKRLPVDVGRIHRELRQSSERQTQEGLNVRFEVDVFGNAPPIQLFTAEDNLATGPVPYGAPTHQQMLEVMTPQEFRSPVMDFNGLFRWLMEKAR